MSRNGDQRPLDNVQDGWHEHPQHVNGHDHTILVHWHVGHDRNHRHDPVLAWGQPVYLEEDE